MLRAEAEAEAETRSWRQYMAEAARCMSESTARLAGGKYLKARWGAPQERKPPEKTPEEIALRIVRNAGLVYRGDD